MSIFGRGAPEESWAAQLSKNLEYDILYNLEIILNTFENLLTYGLHTFVHGHCVQQADGTDQSNKEGKTMEATIEKVEVIYQKAICGSPICSPGVRFESPTGSCKVLVFAIHLSRTELSSGRQSF